MTTRSLRGDELAVDIDEDRTRQVAGVVLLATTARLTQEPSDIGEAEPRVGQAVAELRGGDEHGPEDTASAETAVARSSYPSRQCLYVPRDDMLRPAARTASIVMTTLLIAACSSGGGSGTTAPSASSAPSAAASSAAPSSAAPSGSAAASGSPAASGSAAAGGDEYEIKTATAAGITGSFLTGADGKTLYIFKKDTQGNGKSTCNGDCAASWPPFSVGAGEQATAGDGVTATKISTVTRDDGSMQVAYDGWPLYYYAPDQKAGDVLGQGKGGVWFAATP